VLSEDGDGNLFVSPYSISQALAMTYAGANGATATQMANTLHFTLDQAALPVAFQTLNSDLVTRGTADADPEQGYPPRSLQIANGLWGEQTFPFSASFSEQLAEYYGAGLQAADFQNDPDGVRDEINGWVAEHTEDKIQGIVPEGAITEDSRLVLANAIYFYGGWLHTFDAEATEDADFHLIDGTTTSVPFMGQMAYFSYGTGDGFQVIELPYAGSQLAFTVILPDEGQFEAVESALDPEALDAAIGELESRELILTLPRFEFEYSASLADTLIALGMTDAFDADQADFSGMLDASAPEPLVIGDVLHKAFISVDEEGTEAAAATAVLMAGAAAPSDPPLEVSIDRPFVFLIRDTETGAVLFIGRVMDPSGA
jgi:serpin B